MLDAPPSALVLALIASLSLAILMAAASLARTGLRGRKIFVFSGLVLGLLAGLVEIAIAVQLVFVAMLVGQLGWSLWLEIGAAAGVAAFTYLVIVGLATQVGLFIHRKRARRRGDVVALAAGLGLGLALTATVLRLGFVGVWPPSALFVAVVYPPLQLGFVLLLGASTLAAREGLAWRTIGWQATAVLLQAGYQFVLRANDTIGHWLAWLEPGQIGALWLGLIILAWFLGLALMAGLARAEPEPPHTAADPENGLLRARLWVWLAGLVLVPSAVILGLSFVVGLDARSAWIMILALLATPVMAGAILLRTAFTLKRGQGQEREHRGWPRRGRSG